MSALIHRPSLADRVTGAMFWNSLLLPVKTLLTFISSVIVVRVLSQSDYAIFAQVIALLNTVGLWSDLGIENTIAKFIPEVEQRFGRGGLVRFIGTLLVFKFALLALIVVGLFIFWDALTASFHFGGNGWAFLPAIVMLLVLGILSDFALEFLLAHFHQKATNSMDIIFAIVQPILVVLFVWQGWGVPGVLWARLIATLLYVMVGMAFIQRTLNQITPATEVKGRWSAIAGRFTRLSLVTFFNNLTSYFSDLPFVVIALTFYGDLIGVALFQLAFRNVLAPIRQFLISSLSGVPVPLFARLYLQKDFAKLQIAYASLSRFMTLMLLPAAVGLSLLTPNLLRLLFQSRYESAASITVILVVLLFGEALFHPAQLILLAFEENRTFLVTRLVTLASIPLLFITVPAFGAVGAALSIGLVRLASRLYAVAVVQHKFKLAFPFRFFGQVLLASAAMAGMMLLLLGLERPHDVPEAALRTALALALGAGTFLVAFKKLGSIESVDRERIAALKIPFKRLLLNWL